MARHSAEERAASFYRVAQKSSLRPPSRLPHRAKTIWREIVASKPIDYFDVGQLGLLADYCETQWLLEKCRVDLRRFDIGSAEADRPFDRSMKLGARLSTLARQLRLTVQWTVDRRSTQAVETAPKLDEGRLIGGRSLRVVE